MPFIDIEKTTVAFGDWVIEQWKVDTERSEGAGFVLIEMELFGRALSALAERPIRPGVVVTSLRKMRVELLAYRAATRKRVTFDDQVDAVVDFFYVAARDMLFG